MATVFVRQVHLPGIYIVVGHVPEDSREISEDFLIEMFERGLSTWCPRRSSKAGQFKSLCIRLKNETNADLDFVLLSSFSWVTNPLTYIQVPFWQVTNLGLWDLCFHWNPWIVSYKKGARGQNCLVCKLVHASQKAEPISDSDFGPGFSLILCRIS